MQRLLDLLKKSDAFLTRKGVESHRLDAELIFANILGCKKLDLYLRFDSTIDEATAELIKKAIIRRGNREPLQYITGETRFLDIKIKTDRRALIPRPETEELVELVIQEVETKPVSKILDLGTGTGAIGLALAKKFTNAEVIAVDKSLEAIALAIENSKINRLANITFIQSDWFSDVEGSFDIIVSNPPYLSQEELVLTQPEVKDHEPTWALVSGNDGIEDAAKILAQAEKFLKKPGLIALEIGINHGESLIKKANWLPFKEIRNDLCRRQRFFLGKL
ncbi:MAG: peptide chain release factor N(5)-glutamine methyltransferase [Puniceicoccales bacterium]|jgi:release factor glutamine methyltransferase|nr:peptide chain release factor N(5)-glutamine methyltransferase [Puniceicoccales bacterium]